MKVLNVIIKGSFLIVLVLLLMAVIRGDITSSNSYSDYNEYYENNEYQENNYTSVYNNEEYIPQDIEEVAYSDTHQTAPMPEAIHETAKNIRNSCIM